MSAITVVVDECNEIEPSSRALTLVEGQHARAGVSSFASNKWRDIMKNLLLLWHAGRNKLHVGITTVLIMCYTGA